MTFVGQTVKKQPVIQTANSASSFMNTNIGKSMAGTAPINQWNPGMSAGGVQTAAARKSAVQQPAPVKSVDRMTTTTKPPTDPANPTPTPTPDKPATPNIGLLQNASTPQNSGPSPAAQVSQGLGKYSVANGVGSGYSAEKGNSAGYSAEGYNATLAGDNQNALVQSRLKGLLDENNDYIKQARTEGLQQANARGLLNTVMAARAAQGAAIDRALPIAQQDASTLNQRDLADMEAQNRASEYNANANNQASQFNAGNQQQMNLANMEAENRSREYNASNQQNMTLANMDAQNKMILSKMDVESRALLADQDMKWKAQIQADTNANASYNQYLQQFFEINNNKDMTADQKKAGVQAITQQFDTYLQFTNKLRNL